MREHFRFDKKGLRRCLAISALIGTVIVLWCVTRDQQEIQTNTIASTESTKAALSPSDVAREGKDLGIGTIPVSNSPKSDNHLIIESVELEKKVACQYEPVRVTIRTKAGNSDVDDLWFSVGNERGGFSSVVSYVVPGEHRVVVTAHDSSGRTDRGEAALQVKVCPNDEDRLILTKVPAYQTGSIGFSAQIVRKGKLLRAKTAEDTGIAECYWDFGDSTTEVTQVPFVQHDYSNRDRNSIQSSFVVSVVATGRGRTLEGKTSIALNNTYAMNKRRGVISPPVQQVGEAVAKQAANEWTSSVMVSNFERDPLPLETLRVEYIPCAEDGIATEAEKSPEAVLGTRQLAPGESQLDLRLPTSDVPVGTCRAILRATGRTGSYAVALQMGMVLQPPRPAMIDRSTSGGKELQALLYKAAKILGRDPKKGAQITDSELQMLMQSGKL